MTPSVALPAPAASARDRWIAWTATLLAATFFVTVSQPVLPYARSHDFPPFYFASQLVLQGRFQDLYDPGIQEKMERALVPDVPVLTPFVRPPFYALVWAPLSLLPFDVAFVAFLLGQVAALAGLWWWAWRRFGPQALIFSALFVPTAFGIINGQDCVVMLAAVLCGWLALERGRDGWAGAILALALFKFHLLLLLAPAMMLRRKWRMLAAYAAVGAAEAALSLALLGPDGVRQYVRLLTAKNIETISPSPERMMNVYAILTNLWIETPWTSILAVGTVLAAAWIGIRKAREDWQWFWIAAAGSILVAPHVYEYDAALLLPAMLMCLSLTATDRTSGWLRLAAATAALPVPYLCTLLGRPWAIAPSLVVAVWFGCLVAWTARPREDNFTLVRTT